MYYHHWKPYVPVAVRRHRAMRKMQSLRKKGIDIQPVEIEGRKIAKTFWGEAWCDHLESFSDYENRLPRGRTYVRNGSVCHLAIVKGKVEAKVIGSSLYNVSIKIKTLPSTKWSLVKQRCGGKIGSLIELLEGRLSENVMEMVTDREEGLFPLPGEMSLGCDCPDWAVMCKHVAAVLYGVGARLDTDPQLLFTLRGVNHEELIAADAEAAVFAAVTKGKSKRLSTKSLSGVFGVDIVGDNGEDTSKTTKKRTNKAAHKSPSRDKNTVKKRSAAISTRKRVSKKQTKKSKSTATKTPSPTSKKKSTTKSKKTTKKAAKKKITSTRKKAQKKVTLKSPKKSTGKKSPKKSTRKKTNKKVSDKPAIKKKVTTKAAKKKTTVKKTTKVTKKKTQPSTALAAKKKSKPARIKKVAAKKTTRMTTKKQPTRRK